ncbi:MAG TPA: IPT/TIG domain-containing protein, partial [Bryobacteraceae bacterium]|nr:IPT/TIG domain-containing protein [Bryobacteraceae bacterium]
WIPANTSNQMQMQLTARQGTLTPASLSITFAVSAPSPDAPGIPAATLNAASAITPQTVAPGSYVAIYGSALAESGYGLATTTPFTSTLDGTQVFLGGQPMPLYYASPTQINALVPQNLPANTVLQMVVQRGSTRSAPIPLVITPYQPGIYSRNQAGTGQGSIEISGTALLAAPASANSRPAQRGADYIAIYCTGLGPVAGENGEAPPADGVAASYPPLYKTIAPVHVTVGGIDAPVVFAGLTPTLVGLYQVDAQVPDGAPAGDAIPVTIAITDPATGAVSQSNMVTIAVQ